MEKHILDEKDLEAVAGGDVSSANVVGYTTPDGIHSNRDSSGFNTLGIGDISGTLCGVTPGQVDSSGLITGHIQSWSNLTDAVPTSNDIISEQRS